MTGCSREKNVCPTSRTCGGKIVTSRPYSARTWSAAFRAVAVDATTSGRTGFSAASRQEHSASTATSNSPTVVPSAPVIRCSSSWMIRSGGRSRLTGPPVVRRLRVLAARLDLAARVVGVHVPVQLALLRHVAEERRRLALPRQPGELVDGRDDERGRQPVDLLVHREDRQPFRRSPRPGRTGSRRARRRSTRRPAACSSSARTLAAPIGVPHQGQRWNCSTVSRALGPRLRGPLELLLRLLVPLRRHVRPNPQPDPERLVPPHAGITPPRHLRGAHQRGRPLELLRGEQPQRVPHQHGHPGIPVKACRPGCRARPAAAGSRTRRRPGPGTPRSCRRRSGRTAAAPWPGPRTASPRPGR